MMEPLEEMMKGEFGADTTCCGNMGEVWKGCSRLDGHWVEVYESETYEYAPGKTRPRAMPASQREDVGDTHMARWQYFHTPVHSFVYVVNPKYSKCDHFADEEVQQDFDNVLRQFYQGEPELDDYDGDMDKLVAAARNMIMDFKKQRGKWKNTVIWHQAQSQPPHEFWEVNGHHAPLLRRPAMKILTLAVAAGGPERIWSVHDLLNDKRRQSTSADQLSRLVYAYYNQRLLDKINGKGIWRGKDHVKYPTWSDRSGTDTDSSGIDSNGSSDSD